MIKVKIIKPDYSSDDTRIYESLEKNINKFIKGKSIEQITFPHPEVCWIVYLVGEKKWVRTK